jgi:hypothetical protein
MVIHAGKGKRGHNRLARTAALGSPAYCQGRSGGGGFELVDIDPSLTYGHNQFATIYWRALIYPYYVGRGWGSPIVSDRAGDGYWTRYQQMPSGASNDGYITIGPDGAITLVHGGTTAPGQTILALWNGQTVKSIPANTYTIAAVQTWSQAVGYRSEWISVDATAPAVNYGDYYCKF